MWFAKLLLYCVILQLSLGEEEALLEIPQGTLKGLKLTTAFHGMPMYSFKGIPYAAPNVGPNKFRTPVPAESWTGVKDATKHGEGCVYFCSVRNGIFGDEDCLFLNIYTPDLDKQAKRAVMVFFHGGGFNAGSGDDNLYGGDFLVERDVVVVTVNSRLGVAGYLNTGDANAPGNAGLKDQVMALKWVQENIMNFGGCRKRVTIFGHSSGSAAVQFHLLSPMSQGLFSGAIMQSGAGVNAWALSYTPREDAMLLAEKFGFQASSTADLVEKLVQVPTKELVEASVELGSTRNYLNGEGSFFKPSVEADFGQDLFLPADPWELIKSGKIADVPLMVGTLPMEGSLFTPPIIPMMENYANDLTPFIPMDLNITDPGQKQMMSDMLKDFYFHGKPVDMDALKGLSEMFTDILFVSGIALTTRIINSRISSPVYEYLFDFYSPRGFMKIFMGAGGNDIMHGDELPFIFYSSFLKNIPDSGSTDEQKTNEMIEMWTNFAKERNPSVSMDVAKVNWMPMGDDDNYLDISNDLSLKKSMLKERVDFWAKIYKTILGDYATLF